MRMTGQQKWAAACGVQMFIIGVFGAPHSTLAQVAPAPVAVPTVEIIRGDKRSQEVVAQE
jgi:hypothetical protein